MILPQEGLSQIKFYELDLYVPTGHSRKTSIVTLHWKSWSKTLPPVSSMESEFDGTFEDAKKVETLLGTIVLPDGSEYMIGVGNAEHRFSEYLKVLSTLAVDRQRVKDILGE